MTDDRARSARVTGEFAETRARAPAKAPEAAAHSSEQPRSFSYPPLGASVYCEIEGLPAQVDARDLSHAGLFAQSVTPPTLDAEVEVFLRIDGRAWTMRGHVVQSVSCEHASSNGKKPGCALLFAGLADADRESLHATIDAAKRAALEETASARSSEVAQSSIVPKRKTRDEHDEHGAHVQDIARLTRELGARLKDAESKSAWELLGVARESHAHEAKAAYFAASKELHPHRYARYDSPELSRIATELFIAYKRAFGQMQKLSASQRPSRAPSGSPPECKSARPARAAPLPLAHTVRPAPGSVRPVKTSPVPPAPRVHSTPPLITARTSEHGAPPPSLRPGTETPLEARRPRTVEIELLVSDALKQLAASRPEDAESTLRKAVDLDPSRPNARIWLLVLEARRLRDEGDGRGAYEKYMEVLTLDAKHHEALAETMKLGPEGKQPGLLGRLFGPNPK